MRTRSIVLRLVGGAVALVTVLLALSVVPTVRTHAAAPAPEPSGYS